MAIFVIQNFLSIVFQFSLEVAILTPKTSAESPL
jgi:hypothetical protein